jgi:hypothetical protein
MCLCLPSTRMFIRMHESNTTKLHVQVFLRLNIAYRLVAILETRKMWTGMFANGHNFIILILIPCIIDYVETKHLNAPKLYTPLFSFIMAPTCFGKTMSSSGSDYFPF